MGYDWKMGILTGPPARPSGGCPRPVPGHPRGGLPQPRRRFGPSFKPAADAMRDLAEDAAPAPEAAITANGWPPTRASGVAAARLIGAHRDEIALTKNTAADSPPRRQRPVLRSGDRVVVFEEEVPGQLLPLERWSRKGCRLTAFRSRPFGTHRPGLPRARLLAVQRRISRRCAANEPGRGDPEPS